VGREIEADEAGRDEDRDVAWREFDAEDPGRDVPGRLISAGFLTVLSVRLVLLTVMDPVRAVVPLIVDSAVFCLSFLVPLLS